MNKCDVLNLEWGTNTRDTNIVEPVLVSLEERYGYKVVRSSIWYGLFKILYYNPKALLISNDNGALENVKMFQLADSLGIKTISLISEGLWFAYPTEGMRQEEEKQNFWGNNKNKDNYLDLKLLWSNIKREKYLKYVPEAKEFILKVSGGTGFDRFHFVNYMSKDEFGQKYGKNHKKIILLIGYGFDVLYKLYGEDIYIKNDGNLQLYNQRIILRDIYEKLIKNYPEILFVLKNHPGSDNLNDTEFAYICDKYTNTIMFHKEEDISNLLSVSDIVIAFDSTVCLEAWMMGRETILLNPLGKDFMCTILYKGSPIVASYDELKVLIQEYYENGTMQKFQEKQKDREKCIEETIQYGDGANYLRAAKMIDKVLKESSKKRKMVSMEFLKQLLREIKQYLIEKTFVGILDKQMRENLNNRSAMYIEQQRKDSIEKYKKGIKKFENINSKLVINILTSYEG